MTLCTILMVYSFILRQVSSCYRLKYNSNDKRHFLPSITFFSLEVNETTIIKGKLLCNEDFAVLGNFTKQSDC